MNGHAPAVDSPAYPCWWVIKGRQQGVLPPLTIIRERGMPDETALRELSEQVIEKLKRLTDAEFAGLEFPMN